MTGSARVGVVADTHLPRFGRQLPPALVAGLHGVDLVLHLGDLTDAVVLDLFDAIAPTEAVAGNNDAPDLTARLGIRRIVEVGGARIGMTHGHLGRGRTTRDRAVSQFPDDDLDVLAFGHSHIPLLERVGSTLHLNPGSPTDKRRQPRFSYAVLDVHDGEVTADLRTYDSRR
jgi:putative phosphoesterase